MNERNAELVSIRGAVVLYTKGIHTGHVAIVKVAEESYTGMILPIIYSY